VTSPRRATLPLFVALAVTTTFAFGLLMYTVSVMLGPMQDEFAWSNATVSAGPTLGLIVAGLCAPLVGRVIDLRGGRGVMVAGSVVGGAGVIVWSLAASVPLYLGAWGVIGVGMALSVYEPAFATIVRHAPGRRRQGIVVVTLVGALASTIFIPLAAALVELMGWRNTLVVLAVAHVVVTAPLCLVGIPRHRKVLTPDPGPPADRGPRADRPGAGTQDSAPTLADSSPLRRIVLANLLGGAANVAVGVHLVAYLVADGGSPRQAAMIAGLLGIAKVGGRLAVGAAAQHLRSAPLLVVCLVVMGASLALPLVIPAGPVHVLMVVGFGAAAGAKTIVVPLVVVERFGSEVFGLTSGRVSRVGKLGFAFAPVAAGALVTLSGSYTVTWAVLAGGCLAAALAVPGVRADRRTEDASA
jgi:MFS family permease